MTLEALDLSGIRFYIESAFKVINIRLKNQDAVV